MPANPKRLAELLQRAEASLSDEHPFDADELAIKALPIARSQPDLQALVRCVEILIEARGRCREIAESTGEVIIVDEPFDEQDTIEPGCYMIQPPMVGADARRLRLAAMDQHVPIATLCREPLTQIGLTPLVSLCPGTTVRTRVDSPENPETPEFEWFVWAREQLGDWAIDTLDPELEPAKRLDALIDRMTAIPDHEGIQLAVIDACHELAETLAAQGKTTSR